MPTLDQLEVQTLVRLLGEPRREHRRRRWRDLARERSTCLAAVLRLLSRRPVDGAPRTRRPVRGGWLILDGESVLAEVTFCRPVHSWEDLCAPIRVVLRTQVDERLVERLRRHAAIEIFREPCAA